MKSAQEVLERLVSLHIQASEVELLILITKIMIKFINYCKTLKVIDELS